MKRATKKPRSPGGSRQNSCQQAFEVKHYLPSSAARLTPYEHDRMPKVGPTTMKELRAANNALAGELVREKAEHDQDIADARATILSLQSALTETHSLLDATEQQEAERASRDEQLVQQLQDQLREEARLRAAAEKQLHALLGHAHDADSRVLKLQAALGETHSQLQEAKAGLTDAQARALEGGRALEEARTRVASLEAQSFALQATTQEQGARLTRLQQESTEEAAKAASRITDLQGEVARLSQALELERDSHRTVKADLQQLRGEHKALEAQRMRESLLLSSAEDMRQQCEALQIERNALESALVARNAEVEQLKGENKRLAGDWSTRETSLLSSHELRVSNLLTDLTARDKQNGDLHSALHKAGLELQSLKHQHQSLQLEHQALRERESSQAQALAAAREEGQSLQQAVRRHELAAEELKAAHASKVEGLRASVAQEHKSAFEASRRAEVLAVQLEGRDATIAALKEAHQRDVELREGKMNEMAASLRTLGDKLVALQTAHASEIAQAEADATALKQQLVALQHEHGCLRDALERSAAALERSESEQQRLAKVADEQGRTIAELGARSDEELRRSAAAAEEARAALAASVREAEGKGRVVRDVVAAMQSEEQAKLAAQAQVRALKAAVIKLEEQLAAVQATLEETVERCRYAEAERDELRAAFKRSQRPASLRQLDGRSSGSGTQLRRGPGERRPSTADGRTDRDRELVGAREELGTPAAWHHRGATHLGDQAEHRTPVGQAVFESVRKSLRSVSDDRSELDQYRLRLAEIRARR